MDLNPDRLLGMLSTISATDLLGNAWSISSATNLNGIPQWLVLLVLIRALPVLTMFAPILQVVPLTLQFLYSITLMTYRGLLSLAFSISNGLLQALSASVQILPSWRQGVGVVLILVMLAPTRAQNMVNDSIHLVQDTIQAITLSPKTATKNSNLVAF